MLTGPSQKMMDDVYQQQLSGGRATKQSKPPSEMTNPAPRASDPSSLQLAYDEKSVSPSSGRLRTSPRNEVTPSIRHFIFTQPFHTRDALPAR